MVGGKERRSRLRLSILVLNVRQRGKLQRCVRHAAARRESARETGAEESDVQKRGIGERRPRRRDGGWHRVKVKATSQRWRLACGGGERRHVRRSRRWASSLPAAQ